MSFLLRDGRYCYMPIMNSDGRKVLHGNLAWYAATIKRVGYRAFSNSQTIS